METWLICLSLLLNSITSNTINRNDQINSPNPDCQCITKWSVSDIDCTSSNINTIESYLTLHKLNCLKTCNKDNCRQSFSLLYQYYNYCPLGTISQDIISLFITNSTCQHCQVTHQNNNAVDRFNTNIQQCSSVNCSVTDTETSIDYIDINCNNTSNQCDTQCQNNWNIISSYQRQCIPYPLDELYTEQNNTVCHQDCHIEPTDNTAINCSTTHNIIYNNMTKLNINELATETKICFYGLNINDPTQYDLICVNKHNLNNSGITSYEYINEDDNILFWNMFAIASDMDIMYLLICAAIVFFMQTGFTLLEAGCVKAGNVQNIMFKNIMDCCICAVTYWIVGYCVAYGDYTSPDINGFIGVEDILIESHRWADWFFHMAFACTASTIVSGAVAERFRLEPYFIYTLIVSSFVYPVPVHWIWSETGWLSPFNPNVKIYGGVIDFAGSSVVHMIGGFLGLCGAYIVGPRFRRFDRSKAAMNSKFYHELQHQFEFGHNVTFQVMGVMFLWFSFFGFNSGSTLKANGMMDIASLIACNTTISAAAGGCTTAFLTRIVKKTWHIPRLCNGLLAALASITAGCAVVSPGECIVIGIVGSLLYYGFSELMVRLQIDDPLDAFAVHGIGGTWGVLAAGIFATSESLEFAKYPAKLYNDTTVGERFATQLFFTVIIIAWTVLFGVATFGGMHMCGILRVSEDEERRGLDHMKHGGGAYNVVPTADAESFNRITNNKSYD
eukprot:102081_1